MYEQDRHYVYIYRDKKQQARYIGYGAEIERPTSHTSTSGTHNPKLEEFLKGGEYALEIAGPFGSEETGKAVETALISALKPDLNIDPGGE